MWDRDAIAASLEQRIGSQINQGAGSVRIARDASGAITFDGRGLPGRKLKARLAAELTIAALDQNVRLIQLPVEETPPAVDVADPELRAVGIRELVTVGESDFTGSPSNRKNNIQIGLGKFNGHLIPQGAEFSFNEVLGPVTPKEGYRKELTILGERTLPEYGGGLCQVSTTVFRGIFKAGFPITARRNHSFAVRYYAPPGTDATIYPPSIDLRFKNDSDGALLLQTLTEGDHAYVLTYGTALRDRTVELVGPFVWDIVEPPEDRTAYTTEIPEGERRIVGTAVPGLKAMWYRYTAFRDGREKVEPFFSQYEARPNFEEIGVVPSTAATVLDLRGNER
jgi:vancomycin resistance protein YoaR